MDNDYYNKYHYSSNLSQSVKKNNKYEYGWAGFKSRRGQNHRCMSGMGNNYYHDYPHHEMKNQQYRKYNRSRSKSYHYNNSHKYKSKSKSHNSYYEVKDSVSHSSISSSSSSSYSQMSMKHFPYQINEIIIGKYRVSLLFYIIILIILFSL